jgi:hypothetical protein
VSGFWPSIVAIATAIVGLAVVAVVLSPKAQTAAVIGAGFGGFSQSIQAAVNPYSGGSQLGLPAIGDLSGIGGLGTAHL